MTTHTTKPHLPRRAVHPAVAALAADVRALLAAGEEPLDALTVHLRDDIATSRPYFVVVEARGANAPHHRYDTVRGGDTVEDACEAAWEVIAARVAERLETARRLGDQYAHAVATADVQLRFAEAAQAVVDARRAGIGPATRRTERPLTPVDAPPAASTAETVRRPPPDRARVAAAATQKRLAAEREERLAHQDLTDDEAWRAARLLAGDGCASCGRRTEAGVRQCGPCRDSE